MGRTLSVWSCAVTSVALMALGGFVLAGPAQASAQTRYVATHGSDNDNDCTNPKQPCATVQYAVDQADAGDTVEVAAGTYDESVTVTKSLTIEGAGTSGANDTRIDGNGGDSIDVDGLDSSSTPHVTIRDLDASHNSDGSGIGVHETDVTVVDSVASHNSDDGIDVAESPVVALSSVQADADTTPSVTVTGTTTSDNGNIGVYVETGTATVRTATINGNGDGGVVVEEGTAHIAQSTLAGNVGAGLVLDGNDSTGSLSDSTVADTVSFDNEQNPTPYGGGVLVFPTSGVDIDTSTIDGNQGQGVLAFAGTVTIANSTISGTRASTETGGEFPDGGIAVTGEVPEVARAAQRAFGSHNTGTSVPSPRASTGLVTVTGTIDADNDVPACSGDTQAIGDHGYNLADDASCPFTAPGSKQKAKAKIGALADNGGPTETRLPAKGSAAIDAIPVGKANCSNSATDQRGVSRPQGHRCDIGAVEANQPPIVITPKTLPQGTVGKHYRVQLTATGGLGAPYEFSLAPGSGPLPAGLSLTSHGLISGTPKAAGTYPITVSVDDPTLRHYVIVIAAAPSSAGSSSSAAPTSTAPSTPSSPASPATHSTAPLAATGTSVVQLTTVGIAAIAAGVLMMFVAGWTRARRRHRPRHIA